MNLNKDGSIDGKSLLESGYDNKRVIVNTFPISDRYCNKGKVCLVYKGQIRTGNAWFNLDERWIVTPLN